MSPVMAGSLGSLLAGLATVIGALPILGLRKPDAQQQNLLLGFAAGVMLAAAFFSLIIPGIEAARDSGLSRMTASLLIAAAVLGGAVGLAQLNHLVPPLDKLGVGPAGMAEASFRQSWLLLVAITLHNFPEGAAVGVSFGTGDFAAGRATALGIGLQNIPEGLAVAVALTSVGCSRAVGILAALLSGLFAKQEIAFSMVIPSPCPVPPYAGAARPSWTQAPHARLPPEVCSANLK
ncbi:ZIP family metal transporter [Sphingobium sp. SCG-1]|nr:ZIP family metal transporter [Sphingobium sp. SCG-1]